MSDSPACALGRPDDGAIVLLADPGLARLAEAGLGPLGDATLVHLSDCDGPRRRSILQGMHTRRSSFRSNTSGF